MNVQGNLGGNVTEVTQAPVLLSARWAPVLSDYQASLCPGSHGLRWEVGVTVIPGATGVPSTAVCTAVSSCKAQT